MSENSLTPEEQYTANKKALGDIINEKSGNTGQCNLSTLVERAREITSGSSLNIEYSTTEPSDTTKLWVKTSITPSKVSMSNVFNGAIDNTIATLSTTLPQALSNTCCGVVGTNCYIFGGMINNNVFLNTIYKYDTINNTITTLSTTLPQALSQTCCGVVGTNCYIFGGNHNGKVDTIYKYDTINNTITTLSTTLPQALYETCCGVVGTNCYIFGGFSDNGKVDTIYKYDTINNTITTLSTTLPQKLYGACCGVVGTNCYIFGGYGGWSLKTIYKYDTINNTIATLSTTLPQTLSYTCCGVVGTNCYIFGGDNDFGRVKTIYKYDTINNTVATLSTTLPQALSQTCCGVVGTNCYIFGGYNNDNGRVNTIYDFSSSFSLTNNNLFLINTFNDYVFKLINSDTIDIETSISQAYLGNTDNHAEVVKCAVYYNNSWLEIN